ncbi:MAG: polyamine aminopropyltransferase [Gammaproteobacteria bacterium]|jgi:spermidine synthase
MALDDTWFTEIDQANGSAFSIKIKARLHDEQTPFQRVEIYDTVHWGKLMVIDGFYMLSTRDNFIYHEMMSHPALFTHPDPKKVLIIGGGDCGTLSEVLKHRELERVWQVDIDEAVTRLSQLHFPELCASNDDPRASLLFDDGIKWVRDAEADSLDIIIVDSTDPIGPAEGLFNQSFYGQCHRVLRSGGLLVQQSESPLYHLKLLKEMHGAMRGAGFKDARTHYFPQPVYPSGWWSATMACKDADLRDFRVTAARNKGFKTRYYNADVHRAALAQPAFCGEAGLG